MQLSDYAQALGAAQRLVPNFRDQEQQDAQTRVLQMQPKLIQQQMDQAQEKQQWDEQRRGSFSSALAALGAKPTPDRLYRLGVEFPEFAQTINQAAKGVTEDKRAGVIRQLAPIQALIQNGQAERALAEVNRHIDADKAAGLEPDENDVELRDMLASKDPAQIKAAGGIVYGLLAAVNPDTAAANITKQGEGLTDEFSSTGDGAIYNKRTGDVVREGPRKAEYRTINNADGSQSIVQVGGSEGGGQASGGGGASGGSGGPASGRTQYGWTPRARNGGDNTDAAVDGKIAGMASALGVSASAPFPADMTNRQIAQALTLSEGGKGSLADRNNNPGNLTDARTGAYRKFPNKEAGLAAATAQVARNRARGQNTIQSMVEGLPVGGQRAPSSGGGGAKVLFTSKPNEPNQVDQQSVRFYAEKVAAGGDLPALGAGKESAQWRRAILQEAARIQAGNGLNGGDSNLAQADVKANRSALLQAQKQYTSTVGFEDTFQRNVKEVLRLAPQGVGGSSPVFNRWIQSGRKNIAGDPAVSAFNVAVNTAANEYAKLASGASGGAVTSDSARHEAMEILNNAQTLPQLRAAIRQMQIDGHNRVIALDTQLDRLRGNIRGAGGGNRQQPSKASAPQGGKLIGLYQGRQVYQLPNGKRVVAK